MDEKRYQAAIDLTQERYFDLSDRYNSSNDPYEELAILDELETVVSRLRMYKNVLLDLTAKNSHQYSSLD